MNFEGRVAIVTGASRGIGAATATLLAAHGAAVVINYRDKGDDAHSLSDRINADHGRAIAVKASVSDGAAVKRLFAEAHDKFGVVSILVNNAAVHAAGPISDVTETEFHRSFDTIVLGAVLTSQAFVAQASTGGGSIVNVASAAVATNLPGLSLYTASKAALVALTKVLARELGPRNIKVNAVAPGVTDTASLRDEHGIQSPIIDQLVDMTPLGRLGVPDDIAKVIAFLASDDGAWITGELIFASGGYK